MLINSLAAADAGGVDSRSSIINPSERRHSSSSFVACSLHCRQTSVWRTAQPLNDVTAAGAMEVPPASSDPLIDLGPNLQNFVKFFRNSFVCLSYIS